VGVSAAPALSTFYRASSQNPWVSTKADSEAPATQSNLALCGAPHRTHALLPGYSGSHPHPTSAHLQDYQAHCPEVHHAEPCPVSGPPCAMMHTHTIHCPFTHQELCPIPSHQCVILPKHTHVMSHFWDLCQVGHGPTRSRGPTCTQFTFTMWTDWCLVLKSKNHSVVQHTGPRREQLAFSTF
jgi:hypothetical protein